MGHGYTPSSQPPILACDTTIECQLPDCISQIHTVILGKVGEPCRLSYIGSRIVSLKPSHQWVGYGGAVYHGTGVVFTWVPGLIRLSTSQLLYSRYRLNSINAVVTTGAAFSGVSGHGLRVKPSPQPIIYVWVVVGLHLGIPAGIYHLLPFALGPHYPMGLSQRLSCKLGALGISLLSALRVQFHFSICWCFCLDLLKGSHFK